MLHRDTQPLFVNVTPDKDFSEVIKLRYFMCMCILSYSGGLYVMSRVFKRCRVPG